MDDLSFRLGDHGRYAIDRVQKMHQPKILWATLLLTLSVVSSNALAQDREPVHVKLEAAKAAFDSAVEKSRKSLDSAIVAEITFLQSNKRITAEEKLKRLETLNKQLDAFRKDGTLPTIRKLKAKARSFSRVKEIQTKKLISAYDKAANQYAKSNDLISAKAVLDERDAFKANRSEQWTQLFNGRDLADWSIRSTVKWVVNNSVIHGTGAGKDVLGCLVAPQEVDNFKLRVRAIAGSGKILFRARSTRGRIEGYYLSLETDPGARSGTVGTVGRFRPFHGSTRLVDPPKTDVVPGKVVNIELTAIGNEFTIKVDDSIPAKGHDRDKTYAHGSLVLRCGKKTKIAVGSLALHHIEAEQYDEPK